MKNLFGSTVSRLLVALIPFMAACTDKENTSGTGTVQVAFENVVGTQPLQLDDATYTSPAGHAYTVSTFKYYLSNVKLLNAEGRATYIEPESYHLIAQGGKLSFDLKKVPADTYTKIEFSIGIDEELNHRVDHQGDLDPSNDMVWDWDTGYKFLSLVGNFTGNTRSGGLVFHVGGDANYKTLVLDLPQPINLRQKNSYQLQLRADVNEIFQNPHTIDFDQLSSAGHGTGPNIIAENYSHNNFLKIVEVN